MSWAKISESTRTLLYCVTVFSIVAAILWFVAGKTATTASTNMTVAPASPQAIFPGTNTGAIPDGLSGTPPQFGATRVINFAVSGVSAAVTDVSVDMTLTHTWVGDVDVILRAPGGTPSMVVVSRIGVTTAGSFGSANDYSGTYSFTDLAAGANIWTAAATNPVPVGSYRTTGPGQTGQTNPAPVTSLNTTFAGITPANANGTWTLTFRDAASADLGSVSAANLTVNPTGPVVATDAPLDVNGDSKTDYVLVRNVGGGPSGQIGWFFIANGSNSPVWYNWGLNGDEYVMEDFDGDGKDDITTWRAGTPGNPSFFYILESFGNTARVDNFGQQGDDPSVVGDYDGDGTADVAVYRSGLSSGDPSTWFYRGSLTPGNITYIPWGMNGDFVSPGDYDGDGKHDFVIQRNGGGGQARFWQRLATGATDTFIFGTPTDNIVPGDYDGDGKCDIGVFRGNAGQIDWYIRSSLNSSIITYTFGISATDFSAQGDYDGDGKIDIGIWRPNVDPTQNFFWSRNSSNGAIRVVEFGQNGDYPVANFNRH